jgi:hypothetical protein
MKNITAIMAGILWAFSALVFAYAVFTLVGAEFNTSYSRVQIDPTFAVAWLLVALFLGKAGGVCNKAST